ncbi:MAG: cobalt transporter CbiM [Pseudomonadota bacterium]|jgi:cobalt/nickel transport system permease protein
MHIADGIISIPILIVSSVITVIGINIGLKQLEPSKIPLAAMLAAVFFLAGLIHLPIGFGSVHLVMNGLCGILLGWAAFPIMLVVLLLQVMLFGFGGITTLGLNTLIMALPALPLYYLLGKDLWRLDKRAIFWRGCLAGILGILLGSFLMSGSFYLTDQKAFQEMSGLILLAHLPVMLVESIITGTMLVFLYRVEPQWLQMRTVLSQTDS